VRLLDTNALRAEKGITFSKTHRWRQCRDGRFPQPIKVGSRVYWLEHEIDAWIAARAREREFTRRRVDRASADKIILDAEATDAPGASA
jgi:predicted DNA-binding transcriptional regulator AlpA